MSFRLTPELLQKAMKGEQNAIAGYEAMKAMTNDSGHLRTLDHIISDERKHLMKFEDIYRRRFGAVPDGSPAMEPPACMLMDCIRRSVEDELASYEMYRNIYLDNGGEQVRQPFFEAMTDENEHAIRLNMMFARELEKRVM
jgi:rubrerythrin